MATNIIIGVLSFIVGAIAIYLITVRSKPRKSKKAIRIDTFSKLIVSVVVIHGMLLTTASYVLAFFDKDSVCSVSEVLVREIVAPITIYLATNMIMNIFEKNNLKFSVPMKSLITGPDGEKHVYSGATGDFIDEPQEDAEG